MVTVDVGHILRRVLLVGGASFAMHSIRRQWYMQDLNDIQFVFSRLEEHDVTNSPLG